MAAKNSFRAIGIDFPVRIKVGSKTHCYFFEPMRPLGPAKKSVAIEARISAILLEVEPLLRIEHCRIELVAFASETGSLTLRIGGECPDCDMSPATFAPAIAAHVKQRVPEVREVRLSG